MAGIYTHLAIAKRYIEKNPDKFPDDHSKRIFYGGNIWLDLTPDKEQTHCGNRSESKDLIKRHREKVNLERFLSTNDIHWSTQILGNFYEAVYKFHL